MQYRHSILTLALLGMALCVGAVQAQDRQTISGTVTSADDAAPLPGANVSVPGTTAGTATNAQGQYSLQVPTDADSLRFSFVGFRAQTVPIAGRTTIDVALAPAAQQIDELVVVGYGEQQAGDVTGSVDKVDAADFNESSNVSPEKLISGKVSGVQISSSSGAPGAGSFIRIRGPSSVNASSRPLFVVDGVPITNDGNTAQRNPLNFLSPNDIANITVLKDASATAIYGSRGANGVILIETKNAEEGEANVNYSGSISSSSVTDQIDMLSADQFRGVVRQKAPSVSSRLGDTNTDWQDLVQRTALGQSHSLSFSRGYEDSDVRLSLNYLDEEGILQSSSTERVSLSLNYNQDLLDNDLTVRTSLKGSKTTDIFEPGSMVGNAASFDPTQPVRDPGSPYGGFFEWENSLPENNPIASYVHERNSGETFRGLGNVEAEYRVPFLTGLSLRANVGADVTTGEREFFAPTFLKGQAESTFPGSVTRANFRQLNTRVNAFFDYTRDIEQISSSVEGTLGYSWQEFNEEYPEYSVNGLSTNIYGPNRTDVLQADSLSQASPTVSEIPSRLISVFARVNYTFQEKYLLTATVRRDGSSKFGPTNRWGTFPSAAIGWRIHREPFMEDVASISTLKVRLSAGTSGNQEIGDFNYAPFYTTGGRRAQALFGDGATTTIRPRAADQTIQWEETTTYNAAIDYGLLDGRISGSLEFYRKDTDNLLFNTTAAGFSNLSNFVLTNVGEMRNQGVEFSVDGSVVNSGNFSYDAQFNASYNKNELLSISTAAEQILTGGISGGIGNQVQVLKEGEPINSFFTYEHVRDGDGSPLTESEAAAMDTTQFVDVNADGNINAEDRQITGNPRPDVILGHTSNLRYQNFDLSLTLRAQLGQQVYNNVASNFGNYDRIATNQVPTNVHESVLETNFQSPQYLSDEYVEDASFLRLDNVTLGYTIRSIPSVDRLRIYGRVSNALVLTGYSGPDPEVYSSGVGIDDTVYPRSRTWTAGLNIRL
ncbi:iron complex outermembrane receptor protein [Salinibacter ruber]|uniref:Iron complex outermembrane receptor protein n=1 Tax=Salinibacter ruber TaxID=146919 RepID=A0AAW5P9A0_9BACT|nr:SusC/RagA family TonB-linked outer membrane protein [Salinibacter ruber]MCS3663789.1 iron complex outermembrane receptor protein [Salinibacter ruber]MCS3753431.1 iron complex outermembrane receptor protein [Salinibacter ruber]MCS4158168.1 iron complex outermembrane receptor protein [Salinibacter ruber]MCS4221021.1 iron complex outermembrane receptor protein [Salinibacter ruber]